MPLPKPRRIRGGMGLGDALYVQGVVRHLVGQGKKLVVHTAWPDVFIPHKGMVKCEPFTRANINILAHYSLRKIFPGTSQFRDCCLQAGITEKINLKLDWQTLNQPLIDSLPKPYVLVQLPRNPMNRTDGFGKELLPDCRVIQKVIDRVKPHASIVQIGAGKPLFEYAGIDVDLSNRTSVTDLLDVGLNAAGFIGYCSFAIPLAESFDKPGLYVWSRMGLQSKEHYIHTITPRKVIEKPHLSRTIIDDCSVEDIGQAATLFLQAVGGG